MDQSNLKTHDGLPAVKDSEGRDMSEFSITVTDSRLNKGRPTNIPSLWNGEVVSEDEAVENALKTGKQYQSFDSIKEAVDDAIRKSEAGGANAPTNYARGGNVQQMKKLFAEGGMMDDSGEQVNGVKVPPGSLKEEVADDIPARLSEGEFVIPADVVRYIGLEKLMALRDKAKQGLQRMQEMGQMGNADEVENPDQTFAAEDDDMFEQDIDSILEEDEAMPEGFALGGIVTEADIPKMEWTKNPVVDVRYFKHADGRVMFITYINGKPSTSIPEGFKETKEPVEKLVGKAAEEKEKVIEEAGTNGRDSMDTAGGIRTENDYGKMAEFYAANPTAAKAAKAIADVAKKATVFNLIPETPYAKAEREKFENALKGIYSPEPGVTVNYAERDSWGQPVVIGAKGTEIDAEEINEAAPAAPGSPADVMNKRAETIMARQTGDVGITATQIEEADRAAAFETTSRTSTGDTRSFEGAGGRQTQQSLESDRTGGFYGNRGGLVDKRHKPATKKKGLAAKKK